MAASKRSYGGGKADFGSPLPSGQNSPEGQKDYIFARLSGPKGAGGFTPKITTKKLKFWKFSFFILLGRQHWALAVVVWDEIAMSGVEVG